MNIFYLQFFLVLILTLSCIGSAESQSVAKKLPTLHLKTEMFRTHVIVSPGSPGKGEGEEGDEDGEGEDDEEGKYEGRPGVARPLNKGKKESIILATKVKIFFLYL